MRDLLGDRITDFAAQRRTLRVDRFADGAAFRDYFKANYGPTIAAYRGIAMVTDSYGINRKLYEMLPEIYRRHDVVQRQGAPGADSVEFRLFGGVYGYNAPVLCTATLTLYGWLCSWNTTTVPNGSYALLSEAFNSAGSAFSSGVSITVHN